MDKNRILFTVGPLEMEKDILDMGSQKIPYFRTEEFSDVNKRISENIKQILNTEETSKVAILTASGTAAMEASVINIFDKKDKILIVDGGSFGARFIQICDIYDLNYETIKLEIDEELSKDKLDKYRNCGFTGMLINVHETSTCKYYDMNIVGDFCKSEGITLIVDSISSFLADEYFMDKWNIGATIISSQKALALPPGLSLIVVNKKTYQTIMKNKVKSLYFDLKLYFNDMERGQTPFTPAVSIVYQLDYKLQKVINKGIDNVIGDVKHLAKYFRNKVSTFDRELPFNIPVRNLSNAATPIMFKEGVSAYDVYLKLRNENGIVVCPNGGKYRDSMFRVGHIGNLTTNDIDELFDALLKIRGI